MIKLFAEIKFKGGNCNEDIFDIEEAISYFEGMHEMRFFQELPSEA